MLGAKKERLEDAIVRHLARRGASSASDIQLSLNSDSDSNRSKGIPAIYKSLRNLVSNHVVVHRHGSYQLSHTWLFNLAELIEGALNLPFHSNGESLLPSPGGQFLWRHSDLRSLNLFASHLITSIARTMPGATLYAWTPHPWFNLAQDSHEKVYYQALKKYQIITCRIIGGDDPLDHIIMKSIGVYGRNAVYIGNRSFLPRQQYIVLLGEFIITMRLSKYTANSIDALFMRTTAIENVDIRLFQNIFKHNKNPAQLLIEHNKQKSKKLSERFKKFWI